MLSNHDETSILKHSMLFLGILSFLGTLMFSMLTKKNEIHLSTYLSYTIVLFGLITSLNSILSFKIKKIQFTSILFLSVYIAVIGSFQQMNISLLFIIPVFLGYYYKESKKSIVILHLNIFLFNISKIFKSINIYNSNPHIYNFKLILISNLVISIIESLIFLSIALPVFNLLIKQNRELKVALKEKEDATNDILQFCSTVTSFHNKYLSIHIKGVRDITRVILDALIESGVYIDPYYYEQIVFSVQFHDIGKIYIDSSILDKNGKLTDEEFNFIKEHPDRGIELFKLLPKNVLDENYITTCKNVISQHHERLDGTGYPTGTKDLSFEAKIVSIADVVDALLSWRPYKAPLSWETMVSILEEQKSGFSYECLKIVYQEKDKILAISNANNNSLKELLDLSDTDITRQVL